MVASIRRMATVTAKQLTRLREHSADDAIACMRKDGAVIVERVVSLASIQQSLADVRKALKNGYGEYKEGDFFEGKLLSLIEGFMNYTYILQPAQVEPLVS